MPGSGTGSLHEASPHRALRWRPARSRNARPLRRPRRSLAGISTVPAPTSASGNSRAIRAIASMRDMRVRRVISSTGRPSSTSARASGTRILEAIDREHRHHGRQCEERFIDARVAGFGCPHAGSWRAHGLDSRSVARRAMAAPSRPGWGCIDHVDRHRFQQGRAMRPLARKRSRNALLRRNGMKRGTMPPAITTVRAPWIRAQSPATLPSTEQKRASVRRAAWSWPSSAAATISAGSRSAGAAARCRRGRAAIGCTALTAKDRVDFRQALAAQQAFGRGATVMRGQPCARCARSSSPIGAKVTWPPSVSTACQPCSSRADQQARRRVRCRDRAR